MIDAYLQKFRWLWLSTWLHASVPTPCHIFPINLPSNWTAILQVNNTKGAVGSTVSCARDDNLTLNSVQGRVTDVWIGHNSSSNNMLSISGWYLDHVDVISYWSIYSIYYGFTYEKEVLDGYISPWDHCIEFKERASTCNYEIKITKNRFSAVVACRRSRDRLLCRHNPRHHFRQWVSMNNHLMCWEPSSPS